MNKAQTGGHRGLWNALLAAFILATLGGVVVADSFMSSTKFKESAAQADGTECREGDGSPLEPNVSQMLAAMEWKRAEDDGDSYDLGDGVQSPQSPRRALLWCENTRKAVGRGYRFLALYKANWDCSNGDLLAEMQKIRTELAFESHPDKARQAVMALGVAIAALQVGFFGSNSLDPALIARCAGSSFAEAIAHTRSIGDENEEDRRAIRVAIQSAWDYVKLYKAPTAAFKQYLTADMVEWLYADR